jgi:hypothetical protein
MNIHYRVVEVWPENHSIVVRYWTDNVTEDYLKADDNRKPDGSPWRCRSDVSLTFPIPAPTGEELDKWIKKNAPVVFLETQEKVLDPYTDTTLSHISEGFGGSTSKEELKTIAESELKVAAEAIKGTTEKPLTDEEIEKLISNIKSNS